MIKVLFVCLGNICRSPMADAVFQQMVNDAGLSSKISVDSAGTGSWHIGESAHRGTLNVLRKNNIPYNGRARQFRSQDMADFDYVLAMDYSNLEDMKMMARGTTGAETRLFLSYAFERGLVDMDEVPDPYYTGRFDDTYDLVTAGCRALLDYIRAKHNL